MIQTFTSIAVKLNESPALINKSLDAYKKKRLKSCECCARVLALPDSSAAKHKEGLTDGHEKENSLALVPSQKLDDASSYSIAVVKSDRSRPGWLLLRQVFLPKKHMRKSLVKNTSVFQQTLKQTNCPSSAVVHPDHKQNIDHDGDSSLDGESGAIVPFGSDDIITPPHFFSDLSDIPEELLGLREKYSSSCRLYSFQELVSATANFSRGLF